MPNRALHLQKAQRNEEFAHCLRNYTACSDYYDWEVVGIFYAALHLVDARLASSGIHPRNHAKRNQEVENRLRFIGAEYLALYNMARDARYKPQKHITPEDADKARTRWFSNITALLSP